MSVVAPPEPPRPDALEALIREARARRRKRWLGTAAVVALLAAATIALDSIVAGGSPHTPPIAGPTSAVKTRSGCGVRGKGVRILDASGKTVYREPGHWVHPNAGRPEIRCSEATIWAVWDNGAGMSQEAYVGARSVDRGRTWKRVFAERLFGVKAPHELDAELDVWTVHGSRDAYFTGRCPACGWGTVSLWVTKNGGRTFRRYRVPALTGYAATAIGVSGTVVTIAAQRWTTVSGPARRTVTIHTA